MPATSRLVAATSKTRAAPRYRPIASACNEATISLTDVQMQFKKQSFLSSPTVEEATHSAINTYRLACEYQLSDGWRPRCSKWQSLSLYILVVIAITTYHLRVLSN